MGLWAWFARFIDMGLEITPFFPNSIVFCCEGVFVDIRDLAVGGVYLCCEWRVVPGGCNAVQFKH